MKQSDYKCLVGLPGVRLESAPRHIIEECHDLLHRRTVILITHRPASLALADRVLKLENGSIEIGEIPLEK